MTTLELKAVTEIRDKLKLALEQCEPSFLIDNQPPELTGMRFRNTYNAIHFTHEWAQSLIEQK